MNKSIRIIFGLLIVLFITAAFPVMGQDTLRVELAELIARATASNRQLNVMNKDIRLAQTDVEMSKAVYLPTVKLENNGVFTTNPLNAFGFKLQEEIIKQSDFNPDLLNDPDMTELYSTKIEVLQPLVNLDGFHARNAAKSKVEAVQLQKERAIRNISFEISQMYHQLQLMYESAVVIHSAKKTAEENLKITLDMLEQGYVKKADELEVRLHISELENHLLSLSNNIRITSQVLTYIIGSDEDFIIKPMEQLVQTSDFDKLDMDLLTSRSDIRAMDKGIEAYQHMIKSNKMKKLPRLNAMGNYQWNDDRFLGFSAGSYTLGFNLSWNIFNGNKDRSGIKRSEIELERSIAQKEDILAKSKMEIQNEMRKMEIIRDKENVLKLAIEHAEESLRIRTNLYEQGLERTSELLASETNLLAKKLEFLSNKTEQNILMQKIDYLLEK
jgi:outer membrane protein TolC